MRRAMRRRGARVVPEFRLAAGPSRIACPKGLRAVHANAVLPYRHEPGAVPGHEAEDVVAYG